jgi:hypothetical protein
MTMNIDAITLSVDERSKIIYGSGIDTKKLSFTQDMHYLFQPIFDRALAIKKLRTIASVRSGSGSTANYWIVRIRNRDDIEVAERIIRSEWTDAKPCGSGAFYVSK